jgi:apolipoprotein D and lipocalin family protein
MTKIQSTGFTRQVIASMFALLVGALVIAFSKPTDAQQMAPLQAISSIDLQKYKGRWYEIAKYPNRFQSMCAKATSAQYALQEGGVSVLNTCTTDKNEITQVMGEARPVGVVTNEKLSPAQLEVAFAPKWIRWLPAVWGNYWVVAIDPNYRWSLVSEPKREFAWVLARDSKLTDVEKLAVLVALRAAGLDEKRLEWTRHNDSAN